MVNKWKKIIQVKEINTFKRKLILQYGLIGSKREVNIKHKMINDLHRKEKNLGKRT